MPALNEAENLPNTIEECAKILSMLTSKYEIILVDDYSTDSTPQVLANLKMSYPCLHVISNKHNLGCHPSALVGFKAASCDISIFLPADGQIPLCNISRFLSKIGDYDLVCSYRHKRADSFFRHLASRLYNTVLRLCFGISLHDTHSAIAVKKEVVQAIVNEVQSPCAFAGCEFILRALKHGFKVTEIEIDHKPRTAGKATGVNLRDAIWTPLNLLQLFREMYHKNLTQNKKSRTVETTLQIKIWE